MKELFQILIAACQPNSSSKGWTECAVWGVYEKLHHQVSIDVFFHPAEQNVASEGVVRKACDGRSEGAEQGELAPIFGVGWRTMQFV